MLVSNSFGRTNMCGDVNAANKGEKVVLLGWVQRRRFRIFNIFMAER